MGSWHRDRSPFFPLLSPSQSPCDPRGHLHSGSAFAWWCMRSKSREIMGMNFLPIYFPWTLAEHQPSTWGVTGYIWTAFIAQTHSWCVFFQTYHEVPSWEYALVNMVLDGCRKRATSGINEGKMGEEWNKAHYLCPFGMPETFREVSQGNCSRKQLFLLFPRF